MPGAGTATAPAGQQAGPQNTAAAVGLVPFTRAAHEHVEPFWDNSLILDTNTHQIGPIDVPAYGFLRGIRVLVNATGGVASVTVAAQEDAPWIALQQIVLADVNSAPIVGPFSGFDLYLVTKWGGYYNSNLSDPRTWSTFSATAVGASASGNFAFELFIPVEICPRDALGSLANQNSSSTYKITYTHNNLAGIYSTAPNTTAPTMRVRFLLSAWTQPDATDLRGNPCATTPPAHGTTAFWSKTTFNLATGQQTQRLPRVGNYIRNIIIVVRDNANGTRATGKTDFPDPFAIYYDTRLLKNYIQGLWQSQMERIFEFINGVGDVAGGIDNGVFVEDYMHEFDGTAGYELRDLWLPTVQSTRLEVQGQFSAATKVDVITNDISPVGQVFI